MFFGSFSTQVVRYPKDTLDIRRRVKTLAAWGILGFLILLGGLWYRQIIQGKEFALLSERNHIRLVSLEAPRGHILDRNKELLADNRAFFQIVVVPQEIKSSEETAQALGRLLEIDKEKIVKRLRAYYRSPFEPIAILREADIKAVTIVEERKSELAGVFVRRNIRRNYPSGKLAAHLLGYLGRGEVSPREAIKYGGTKIIGKTGIEALLDVYLSGQNGGQEILINSRGVQVGILGEKKARPGNNIVLTIDKKLQEAAERALEGKRGAIVAIDPQNGDILALVSAPAFDPNIFTRYLSPGKFKKLSQDPGQLFFNRAISGLYPPASTFKIVVALAALEEEVLTPRTLLTGKDGEKLNIIDALAFSSDPFFYQLGQTLGVEKIAYYGRALGLGTITGIDLPYEKKGLVPDKKWKKKWHPGEIKSLAIGQGALQVTPLQMANLVAALGNGGKLYRPRLIQEIISPEGKVVKSYPVKILREISFSPDNFATVRRGMLEVVNKKSPRLGTGFRARLAKVKVAGKTGTAESTNRKFAPGVSKPYRFRDHAWFVAFAPYDEPRIALAVIVEHGGWGGSAAAPLARQVLEVFFAREQDK